MRTTRLRVTMRDVDPAVVRVIDVPAASSLAELHELLQAALGWTDSHLHQFTADGVRYGVPDPDWDDLEVQDETTARLRDLPARFEYLYDFGDSWEHDCRGPRAGRGDPRLRGGHGWLPAGGLRRSAGLRAPAGGVWPTRTTRTTTDLRKWAGELPAFDREATNLLLRQTVGEVPQSVRLLLDLLAAASS